MNAVPDNIIVNSCQYTPVYLIQDPGATQGQYFLAQSNIEETKPVSDNLKSFYESSGNLENGLMNVNSSPKPRILKKQDAGVVGNNLKLASFLLPKNENSNKQQYIVNNVILKPNVTLSSAVHVSNAVNTVNSPATNTVSTTNTSTVPRLNIDSKIVKLKDTTFNGTTLKTIDSRRYNRPEKASPKNKPKEIPPILQGAPSKHTSVQLLKLGETYHSLNQLSDEQMKMVTQALKIFSDPEKIAPEPAYDPVTNTRFFYKVVSPRDLTVVGQNKVLEKAKERKQQLEPNIENIIKSEIKKDHLKIEQRREINTKEITKKDHIKDVSRKDFIKEIKKEIGLKDVLKKESLSKSEVKKDTVGRRNEEKLLKRIHTEIEDKEDITNGHEEPSQPKVTRSGRKVKLPKLGIPVGVAQKPKKKIISNTNVTCFQCSEEFPSLYRLQKHYEAHPTHIPARVHSDLFHCLLAIVKSGTDGDRTNIFIQQLEQLIVKLRSLLPCMLKCFQEEGQACTIGEDVGRVLGLNPGRYHLDIEALSCVKNKDGFCRHSSPPPPIEIKVEQNGTKAWITMNNDDILSNTEVETEDCARINSVEKWPTVSKRVWKKKQQKSNHENAKRMRINSENCDIPIELGTDELFIVAKPNQCSEEQSAIIEKGAEHKADNHVVIKIEGENLSEKEVCANIVEQEPTEISAFSEPTEPSVVQIDATPDQRSQSSHSQFHSTHFDIRSSPIKPTSTIFRKFQINPELLAKYEAHIIRSIETVNRDHDKDKEIPCPTVEEILQTNENILQTNETVLHCNEIRQNDLHDIIQSSADILHTNGTSPADLHSNKNVIPTDVDMLHSSQNMLQTNTDLIHPDEDILQTCGVHSNDDIIQNSPIVLHPNKNILSESPDILSANVNVLQNSQDVLQSNGDVLTSQDVLPTHNGVQDALVNDDTLQGIFRDEDLSAVKESFILDRELKDWILNRSNDDKSEDSFSRSTSVIEPALLHVRDDEIKTQLNINQKVDMPTADNHDESSVLNFLETLATDCLSYPGTEIRTNNGDFQMDLFSFHS